MLQQIFYWVFNMSITAALVGLIVMLVRKIKALPRRLAVLLWAIPFLRMTIPFGLNSNYSLMMLVSKVTTKTVVVYRPADKLTFSMTNCVMAADTYFPITYKVNLLEDVFSVAAVVWIIVSLAILSTLAVIYFTTLREIRGSRRLKGNVYISDKVISPAVYGIFKPKIVLPIAFENKDTELLLLHENAHIHRGDNLWRVLAFGVVAFHWFNPLCWLFLKEVLADLEQACDERVLKKLSEKRRKEYALSLLESGSGTTIFTSAFGGAKIRTRIENILSFKKLTRFSCFVFALLTSVIFYVLLTNAS